MRANKEGTATTGRSYPVEAFEHFMLADDRPEQPMTFFIRLSVTGALEFKSFQQAVRHALGRHDMLQMRLVGKVAGKTKDLRWQQVESLEMPFISWAGAGDPILYPADHATIDLTQEIGFRMFVRQSEQTAVILMQVHHAVADGIGALRFLEDVLAYYGHDDIAGAVREEALDLRPIDKGLLAHRGLFHQTKSELQRRILKDLDRAALFFFNFPKPLTTKVMRPGATRSALPQFPAAIEHEFTAEEMPKIRAGAKRQGGTVNDLLLRELFLTLDHWHKKARPEVNAPALRLAMPINMRKVSDERMPCANVVSMAFLDRGPQDLHDPEALMRSIVDETRDIKSNYMGLTLIRVAALMGKLRRGMLWMMTPRGPWRCYSTAVLSNLGQPLKSAQMPRDQASRLYHGGLTLERVELLPPLRPYTYAAFGVVGYAGRLIITLHYDASKLEKEHAQEILDNFATRVRGSMVDPQLAQSEFRKRLFNGARPASAPFWSLPIGKNVSPEPRLPELPPA